MHAFSTVARIAIASIIFAAGFCAPAHAQPAPGRTVDMAAVITDMDGKPIHDNTREPAVPLTLGRAVALALCADRTEDRGLPAVDKAKRCALGLRVMDDKQAALTAAEADQIIKSAGILSPIVAVRLVGLIDPAAMKP